MRMLLVVLLSIGCGASEDRPAVAVEAPATPTVAAYDVHEWGLLRQERPGVLEVSTFAPHEVAIIAVDKPVLYFHAEGRVELSEARVTSPNATLREHWPVTASSTELTWRGLVLEPARRDCVATFPATNTPPCSALPPGETCEASQLAQVVAPDATCITGAHGAAPLLFYRSSLRAFTPPLHVERDGETIRVRNDGTAAIPGRVLRLDHDNGAVMVMPVEAPAPGQAIEIGAPTRTASEGRAVLEATMRELGLTAGEIDAFVRAWNVALFAGAALDGTPPVDAIPVDRRSVDESTGPQRSLLYFLPTSECEQVSQLAFTPPPRNVRRAFALWTQVP